MLSSIPATISKVTTMADGGLRCQVDTQEMSAEDTATLFSLKGKLGWFFFHESEIKEIDTSKLPKIQLEKGEKSPQERMRAVLFIYWEQQKTEYDFDTFYRNTMNKWIDSIKEKLV